MLPGRPGPTLPNDKRPRKSQPAATARSPGGHCRRGAFDDTPGPAVLPSPGNVPLPLHRRDRERRSPAADPARCGKSARVRKPVRSAPTVGHLQSDVFTERSALDRTPSVIFLKRPHYRFPVTNSAMACSISSRSAKSTARRVLRGRYDENEKYDDRQRHETKTDELRGPVAFGHGSPPVVPCAAMIQRTGVAKIPHRATCLFSGNELSDGAGPL